MRTIMSPWNRRLFGRVLLIATAMHSFACIELSKSPFDISQGGVTGLLALLIRGDGVTATTPTTDAVSVSYIAAASSGQVYSSTDASTWTVTTVDAGVDFYSAVYTGQNWVVVGGSPGASCAIYTSADGQTWTAASHPVCGAELLSVATNGSGRVVAGGNTPTVTPVVLVSDDHGATWTSVIGTGFYKYINVVYTNTFLFANEPFDSSVADVYSSDGVTTPAVTIQPQAGAKQNTVGMMYAFGVSVIHVATNPCCSAPSNIRSSKSSNNGVSWTINTTDIFASNTAYEFPRGIVGDNATSPTVLVAVGDNCRVDRTTDTVNLAWSAAPLTMSGCSGINWKGVIHDGSQYVAVGQNTIAPHTGRMAVSATGNATDWTITTPGTAPINHIAFQ